MNQNRERTSISDYKEYIKVCENSYLTDEGFNNFKQNSDYNFILEHVTYEQGLEYIEEILKNCNLDLKFIKKFKENDLHGNPLLFDYGEPFGLISPTTLRYIKVLSDLIKFFGSLDGMSVVEIGVGYGGQSKIIMDYFKIKEYNLIDLPEVNLLTKKYLSKFTYDNYTFLDFEKLPNKKYDLVISNYSITECSKHIQDLYIEKVLKVSKMGYITGNDIGELFGIENYKKHDWSNIIQNSNFFQEVPLTSENNYIMVYPSL